MKEDKYAYLLGVVDRKGFEDALEGIENKELREKAKAFYRGRLKALSTLPVGIEPYMDSYPVLYKARAAPLR